MKVAFVLIVLAIATALADDETSPATITIVKSEQDVRPDGYKFDFETSDGSMREEEASMKEVGTESVLSVKGSYSYIAPDGQVITVNYIADENGFQPDNVPKN